MQVLCTYIWYYLWSSFLGAQSTWKISSKGQIQGNPKFFDSVRYHPRWGFTFRVIDCVSGYLYCKTLDYELIIDVTYPESMSQSVFYWLIVVKPLWSIYVYILELYCTDNLYKST